MSSESKRPPGGHDRPVHAGQNVGAPLHILAVAYLLEPGLLRGRACHVTIETEGAQTLGRTAVDRSGRCAEPPNAAVIDEVDAAALFALLTERLASLAR